MLTSDQLKALLCYDAETGAFSWKVKRNAHGGSVLPGSPAGHLAENGYVLIGLNGKVYRAHRLAWFYVNNQWPTKFLDHIDGNRANNQIANLREVTVSENSQNINKAHKDSTARLLGVEKSQAYKKFVARICINGRRKYLGAFDTAEEAHAVYIGAKAVMHPVWNQQ